MARAWWIVALGSALLMAWGASFSRAGEAPVDGESLASLYREVLKDPTNSRANLRYARAAEVQGQPRLALAAYERVILNDPTNREAQAGFARLRRQLEPSLTQFRLEVGAGYDDNAFNDHIAFIDAPVFFADFSLRDERSIRSTRWRTLASVYGEYPLNLGELLYSYAGVQTGPLFDLSPGLSMHPAAGVAFSTLNKRLFYTEGNLSATFEGRFSGAFQSVRLRGGYRSYGDGFAADRGHYADMLGRLTFPAAFGGRGAIVISPWSRWSGMSGTAFSDINNEPITPGRYVEWGLDLGYYIKPAADLTLGINVVGRQRLYLETRIDGNRREDNYLSPGISVTRSNVFTCACDLLLDYHYRLNRSNDTESSYQGHRVTVSFASHF